LSYVCTHTHVLLVQMLKVAVTLLDISSQFFNIVLLGKLQLGWFTQLKSIMGLFTS